jgi:Ca2+/H+ antiporter, TMEM165/GDT1 family
MDFVPLLTTLALIIVGELGDKTQLTVISLSCHYKPWHVFAGAMLAFLLVDGVSTVIGGPLLSLLPVNVVHIVSGVVFIVFGIFSLIRRKEKEAALKRSGRFPVFSAFSLVALMELGDKTQIITITLAAQYSTAMVLAGVILAFALLTAMAVLIGAKVVSRLPLRWIRIGTSILFIVLGALSIIGALFGLSLL